MDSHERRSRQSNPPGFGGQAQHHPSHAHPASSSNPADSRYRQHTQHHSQSNVPAAAAGRGAAAAYSTQYPYQVPDLQNSASLQYQPTDQHQPQQTGQAQQQQQQHPVASAQQAGQQPGQVQQTYHHGMYYQPPLTAQQAASPPSPYDSYAGRQAASMDVLTNQMVPPGYYVGPTQAEAPTSAPNPASMGAQYANPAMAAYATNAQGSPSGGRGTSDSMGGYAAAQGMTDPSGGAGTAQAQYGQTGAYNSATASQMQPTANLDSAYETYLEELRQIFIQVRDGNLGEAGTALMRITEWLLSSAESLGLVRDEESMHDERLKLWMDFNHCWLAVLQRQKEITIELAQTGQRTPASVNLLEYEQMETMGKELVRLCDVMEKHGLVDYQMGVWEEEIISLLTHCLDLWESGIGAAQAANVTAKASSSRRR